VPTMSVFGRVRLRLPTVLGLQAVAATGLAMLVGSVLGLGHVNWIFWTAFVVIAGSAGESIRRVALRVLGTAAGATVGVALAFALPDQPFVVAALATVGVFMAIFFAPVSYPLMVFWLNLGLVVVFAQLGARELDLLRERPFATTVGGLVAALVTVTVLPIRVTDRFRGALVRYLDALDTATTAWVATFSDLRSRPAAEAASVRMEAPYRDVQLAMSAAAFESNPFPRVGTRASVRALRVAAVDDAFHRFVRTAPDQPGDVGTAGVDAEEVGAA
jgi:uncharacterized membrane protein YccC